LDIYGTKEELQLAFQSFANQIKPNGTLLIFDELKNVFSTIDVKKYGFSEKADFRIEQLRIENGAYVFNIVYESETISDFNLSIGGKHNVINAAAAIAMAKEEGIENEIIKKAIASYTGVKRRFEKIFEGKQQIYIDDYAHHPQELKYTIQSVKDLYPGKKICGIFQPHLFSRTQDLADDFAQSLALLDSLILLEIYPAREEAIPGINAAFLLEKVKLKDKQILEKDEICSVLKEKNEDIILTLGAGDIDRLVNPIYKTLKAKEDE
jgi:UDP-N-acetylmuramate--alanine ligase